MFNEVATAFLVPPMVLAIRLEWLAEYLNDAFVSLKLQAGGTVEEKVRIISRNDRGQHTGRRAWVT